MAGEREDISFGAKVDASAALRVLAQLGKGLRELLGVQNLVNRAGNNRAQIAALREEIATRQAAVAALRNEAAARRERGRDVVDKEISVQKERIKNAQQEIISSQQALRNQRDLARDRIRLGSQDLNTIRRSGGAEVRAAQESARETIRSARERQEAIRATAREGFDIAQKRFRDLKAEVRAQNEADREIIRSMKARIAAMAGNRPGATPAQRGAVTRAQNQIEPALESARAAARDRRVQVDAAREELATFRNKSNAIIAAGRAELRSVVEAEQAKVRAAREGARERIDLARNELRVARQNAQQGSGFARQEVTQARANLAAARTIAAQQIAQARAAARANVQQVQQQIRAGQGYIANLRQQVAALRGAAAAQRAFATSNLNIGGAMRSSSDAVSSFTRRVLLFISALQGIRKIRDFIGAGIEFNQIIESSTLGIASLITAEANLTTQQGKVLQGTEALGAAQVLATEQIRQLRIAGIQTSATTKELVQTFQEAVGAGISVGLTLDQIRKFSVSVAQAATAINLPMNQLQQETRSILQGTIDRNSRIAKALQLTNAEVAAAKAQGRLYDLLNEKFAAFNVAGVEAVKTWAALDANIEDAISLLAGEITEPLFKQLRDAGQKALGQIFDLDEARIQSSFRGIISANRELFDEMGSTLADGIAAAVEGAKELSEWFAANKDAVHETAVAFGTMIREIGGLVADLIGVVTHSAEAATSANTIADAFRTIAGLARFLREHIDAVVTTMEGMVAAGLAAAAISSPIAAAVAGVALLIGYLNRLHAANVAQRDELDRGTLAYARQTTDLVRLTEQYVALRAEMEKMKKGSKEQKDAQSQLRDLGERLVEIDGRYDKVLKSTTLSVKKQAAEMRDLAKSRLEGVTKSLQTQKEELAKAEKFITDLGDKNRIGDALVPRPGESEPAFAARKRQIENIKLQIEGMKRSIDVTREALDLMRKAFDDADKTARGVTLTPKKDPKDDLRKSANDALEAARARLKVAEAEEKAHAEIVRTRFEQGQLSSQEYHNALEAQALHTLDVEKEVADAELALATAKQDQGQIEAAKQHQLAIEEKRNEVISEENRKRLEEEKKFAEDKAKVDIEFLQGGDADDKLIAAARQAAAEYKDALQEAFREKDFTLVLKINTLIDRRTAEIEFNDMKEKVQKIEDDLNKKREDIAHQVEIGVITPEAGLKMFADASRDAQGALGDLYTQALKLEPVLSANPEFEAFLGNLAQRWIELARDVSSASDTMAKFKAGLRSAVQSGILTFFDELGDRSKSASDVVRDSLLQILKTFRDVISQILVQKLVQAIFGSFGGIASPNAIPGGVATPGSATGGLVGRRAPRRATGGGLMEGPGTPTSDSIPLLWVSRKEYVQPAHAVEYYGEEGLRWLEAFRSRTIPRAMIKEMVRGMQHYDVISRPQANRMAVGGSVSQIRARGPGAPTRIDLHGSIEQRLTVDEGGFIRVLEGRTGRHIVMQHVGENRKSVEKVLRTTRRS
jgi:hypothetical protein